MAGIVEVGRAVSFPRFAGKRSAPSGSWRARRRGL